ncbi:unnamed protein product [Ostreobium quekettii]|uniref:Uncharacterized protein n=1 Tax=Ostreobium quekettii TaxID=121088 RepID=A0A8S1J9B1_9CHLO|nr:unnamed protein product [Ostreobium quekettii]|eukprot:evm.model.scf_485EXC.3 EVM.evm.TU.scf_485EXC.3   scf_485EXC:11785-12087(-)
MQKESALHLVAGLKVGGYEPHPGKDEVVNLTQCSLGPEFDSDLANVRADGMTFHRDGEVYRRPCGWRRYALGLLGKYGDDVWLGLVGTRTCPADNEWPVF